MQKELKELNLITKCCKEPVVLNIYKDKNNKLNLGIREICFCCLRNAEFIKIK